MTCEEHNFQYQGIVHSAGHTLPGSGAQERVYHDVYYCTKCLKKIYQNPRIQGNTYEKPIVGALPK